MIDKAPIQAIPPKAFGDKHFAAEFNKFRMFLLSLADEANKRALGYTGSLRISDPMPTIPGLYKLMEFGTYANLTPAVDASGNTSSITAVDGKINEAYYDGTKWINSKISLPQAQNKIDTWIAAPYGTGKQVIFSDQSVYEAVADVASSDVPGVSSKWTKKIGQDKIYVDKKSSVHARITIEGQSNALGVGKSSGLLLDPYNTGEIKWLDPFERVFIWNPKTNNYEQLQIGVNNMSAWDSAYLNPASPTPVPEPTFGPELGIALLWMNKTSKGNLYIDKNTGDGQPISYFQKGTTYYTEKLSRKTLADQWLLNNGIVVREIGFIWVQGENDKNQTESYYSTQLTQLVNDRYTDRFLDSDTELVITQIGSGSTGYGAGVFNAKHNYVLSNKYANEVVSPNSYNSDGIHLNTSGQIDLGLMSGVKILNTSNIVFTDLLPSRKIQQFINFQEKVFYQNIDLSRDNETPYTELIGSTKFTLKSNPKTGKVAIYKLTGGSVTFDTNFVGAPDSPSYNAAKTNIIYFWYEYGKVRYTIEVQDLETVSYANVVSYYQLNGKTPNTLLSAIAPNYGASLTGNTGGYRINSSGTWAATTSNAGSTSSAIGINLGSVVNYRVTLHLSVATLAEVNIGATAYDVWTSFIDINFGATTTIKHIYPGSPAGGAVLVSTTSVTFPQASVYRWDFEVIGNKVKVYFEGKLLTQYTNANTGNIFALILSKTGDVLQSLKIEEL